MERSALADKTLNEMVKAGYARNLISTLAMATDTDPATTFSVLKTMEEIHPGWYSIQRRCKTDIEAKVNFNLLPEIIGFVYRGGYTASFPNNFEAVAKVRSFNFLKKS